MKSNIGIMALVGGLAMLEHNKFNFTDVPNLKVIKPKKAKTKRPKNKAKKLSKIKNRKK